MLSKGAFPLQVRRLVLRPVTSSDVDDLYALYSDSEVAKWLSRVPWPFSQASARTGVANAASDLLHGSGWLLAMLERETAAFVGVVRLRIPALEPDPWTNDAGLGILGCGVPRTRWGAGFASEGDYGGPPRLGDVYMLKRPACRDRLGVRLETAEEPGSR